MAGFSINKWRSLTIVLMDHRLSGKAPGVFARLLDHHNSRTGLCFPSLATLATSLNCTARTVRTALRALEARGYVRTLRGCSPFGTNQYELWIPSGKSEFEQAEKRLREDRNRVSSKPTKQPSKKPTATIPRATLSRCQSAEKGGFAQRTAWKRAELEKELVRQCGGGEKGWEKVLEMPDALLEGEASSMDGSPSSLQRAVKAVLRRIQFQGVYGSPDREAS